MMDTPLTLGGIDDELIPIILILTIGAVLLTLIVFYSLRKIFETRAKETTRREIAAYVAEGSIGPEDAQRLLSSGSSEEVEKKIADAVAWGTISAKKAEGLLRAAREGREGDAPANA